MKERPSTPCQLINLSGLYSTRVKVEQSFHSGTRLSVPAQIPKFSETTSSIRHVTSQPASPAFHHHHDSAKHRLNPPKIVHS
ncbi:hypothetical protein D9758_018344 [Tetrapyrgos nigripes]|uniref:Uncharacterized protein n=1 Tax=Tetrapyrgos nigripes TaxID=182062 RepID=A0A8H5FAK4_9AGAR|nr:hypothetical protein D9758_018344 [Tetrapyrgos nigripes]